MSSSSSDLPKTIISVLLLFSDRKLSSNQVFTSFRQFGNAFVDSLFDFNGRYICRSSAKQWNEMLCFLKMEPRGSRYKAKRIGDKIEPWGTPQTSGAAAEEY